MNYAVAFLNHGRPDLAIRMIDQLRWVARLMVFDNGGTPPLSYALAERYGWAVHTDHLGQFTADMDWWYLRADANLYYAPGCNFLMHKVAQLWPTLDAVWLCNDDILGISPQVADALYGVLADNPQVGMVSPAVRWTGHLSTQPHNTGRARHVVYIDMTCPMVRTQMWHEMDGYDLQFPGYGSDVDLCVRAIKAGWDLMVDDRQVVDHPSPSETMVSAGVGDIHKLNGWEEKLVRKHGKSWQLLTTMGP